MPSTPFDKFKCQLAKMDGVRIVLKGTLRVLRGSNRFATGDVIPINSLLVLFVRLFPSGFYYFFWKKIRGCWGQIVSKINEIWPKNWVFLARKVQSCLLYVNSRFSHACSMSGLRSGHICKKKNRSGAWLDSDMPIKK